jgi:hypothetical protein
MSENKNRTLTIAASIEGPHALFTSFMTEMEKLYDITDIEYGGGEGGGGEGVSWVKFHITDYVSEGFREIIELIEIMTGLKREQICKGSRKGARVVYARSCAAILLRLRMGLSYLKIGKLLGVSHPVAIYMCDAFELDFVMKGVVEKCDLSEALAICKSRFVGRGPRKEHKKAEKEKERMVVINEKADKLDTKLEADLSVVAASHTLYSRGTRIRVQRNTEAIGSKVQGHARRPAMACEDNL